MHTRGTCALIVNPAVERAHGAKFLCGECGHLAILQPWNGCLAARFVSYATTQAVVSWRCFWLVLGAVEISLVRWAYFD